MASDRVRELYKEAHDLMTKAQLALSAAGELTEAKNQEIQQWLQQADKIEARARDLEKVMARDVDLLKEEHAVDAEKARRSTEQAAEFSSTAEYMKAIYDYRIDHERDPRLKRIEQKDLSGEVGSSGGFLVPAKQQAEILTARAEASFLRKYAKYVPMGTRVVPYPAVDYSQGAAGVSAFYGGVQVYYTAENTNTTESQPKFKEIELHARELQGYCEIPNSLIRDSPVSLESFLKGQGSFGGALGWKEDYDSLRGTGGGKLLGILNAPGKLNVTRASGTDFKFIDAITMKSKMLMAGAPIWVINQSVMVKLYGFVDAGNNNLFLPSVKGLADKPVDLLLGYPIIWTEKLPALGTAGDVCLIDYSFYLLGDRQRVAMDIDTSYKFQANQTAFRVTEAIDGQPWLGSTITLADGATTVSPYVVLN